jgi:hypothetical protein
MRNAWIWAASAVTEPWPMFAHWAVPMRAAPTSASYLASSGSWLDFARWD